jgi:hypothetical protein
MVVMVAMCYQAELCSFKVHINNYTYSREGSGTKR